MNIRLWSILCLLTVVLYLGVSYSPSTVGSAAEIPEKNGNIVLGGNLCDNVFRAEPQSDLSDPLFSWPMFRHDLGHSGYSASVAPSTNNTLWNQAISIWQSSPVVADGRVYIGSIDSNVYALDERTGAVIWTFDTGNPIDSTPAVADGMVFVGPDDYNVYALSESTGELVWSYATGGNGFSSPAVADGRVFVGSGDANVYALNESTGELLWNYTTGDSVFSSPAVADGRVFVGSVDDSVYSFNESTGELLWSYATGDDVISSPAVADSRVFVGSLDGNVYALDESTGALIWSYSNGDPYVGAAVWSSPAVADGKVFVGTLNTLNYGVFAIDEYTGDLVWYYTTGNAVFSSPSVADGRVFVGSWDGNLYALDESTGDFVWSYKTTDWVDSSPTVADGRVFVGSLDGNVYAFGDVDLNVTSLKIDTDKTVVEKGCRLNITANILNEGVTTEDCQVNFYANSTLIGTVTVNSLDPGNSANVVCAWNTTEFSKVVDISAACQPVSIDTDPTDNTRHCDSYIKISCLGDINGDYLTDGKDFILVKRAMPSMPGTSKWNPNADVNDDLAVSIKDYQIVKSRIPSVDP